MASPMKAVTAEERHLLSASCLSKAVSNLRFVVQHDLGDSCYVFPKLDDFEAVERWETGTTPCWPRARCLLDREGDDEGCFRIDLEILAKGDGVTDDEAGGDSDEEKQETVPHLRSEERVLSKLVDDLFGPQNPLSSLKSKTTSSSLTTATIAKGPLTYSEILSHLYDGPIEANGVPAEGDQHLRRRKHPGFTQFFGVVRGSLVDLSLTRSSDLSLGSLSKFNRHVLRLFSKKDELSPLDDISSSSAHLETDPTAPALVGANPIVDGECDVPARFLFYQCLRALEHLHRLTDHGGLCPDAFKVTNDLWIELRPPSQPSRTSSSRRPSWLTSTGSKSPFALRNKTAEWRAGTIGNFEYLLSINAAAGRRTGGCGAFHAVLPWVKDFESGGKLRDLTKSKFRLKKGDHQLDTTFQGSSSSLNGLTSSSASVVAMPGGAVSPSSFESSSSRLKGEMPYHIPESLSELTYYVYAARISPIRALQKIVRHNFEPKEYPSSMARLYEWTPDECIPEFYVDPGMFLPRNGLGCLLCGKSKAAHDDGDGGDDMETMAFLRDHEHTLETSCSPSDLAAWIDLNFGASLQGRMAVENKNVVLVPGRHRLEAFQLRRSPEFIRVFEKPHPAARLTKTQKTTTTATAPKGDRDAKQREDEFLLRVFQAMLAPRDGLKVRIQLDKATSTTTTTTTTGESSIATASVSSSSTNLGTSSSNLSTTTTTTTSSSSQPNIPSTLDYEGNPEPTRSTFLGSDLVEWLVRRQIPGVASAADAVALAQKMMAAGFFVPERPGGDDDDFVDADDAYRFRERREVKRGEGGTRSFHQGGDIAVARPFGGTEAFEASDAGVDGLQTVQTYYPKGRSLPGDVLAMGLIVGEMYLGRPVRDETDLDVVPVAVGRALRRVFRGEILSVEELIHDDGDDSQLLFPSYFSLVYECLSKVKMTSHAEEPWKVFCDLLPELGERLRDCDGGGDGAYTEAIWLILPCAYQLMRSERLRHLGQMFIAMRPVVQDDSLMRTLVETCFASVSSVDSSSSTSAGPEWAKYLPAELFLERFVEEFVAARGESKSVERGLQIGLEGKAGLAKRAMALIRLKASAALAAELVRRLDSTTLQQQQQSSSSSSIKRSGDDSIRESHDDGGGDSEDESSNNNNNISLDASMLSAPETIKSSSSSSSSANPPLPPSSSSTSSSSNFRRAVHSRALAHPDAMVTAMAVATDGSPRFVTGTRRGEIALWGWDDHGTYESSRFRCEDPSTSTVVLPTVVHTIRFLPQPANRIMVGISRNLNFNQHPSAAAFDLGKGSAIRSTSWLPNVRCFEPMKNGSHGGDVVCLGTDQSDIVLADLRAPRFVSRFNIPSALSSSGTTPTMMIRCVQTGLANSIVCAMGDRLVDIDPRMMGRVVYEWKTIGKVTRLMNLSEDEPSKRLLLSIMRGGSGASVWDLSSNYTIPKERLRAFAGFEEDTALTESSAFPSTSSAASSTFPSASSSGPSATMMAGGSAIPIIPGGSTTTDFLGSSSSSASASLGTSGTSSNLLFPTIAPSIQLASSFQVDNLDDWDSLTALTMPQDTVSGTDGPFLYVVRGSHKIARIPLKLHDAPLEVRVRPLSLTQLGTSKRYKYGSLCLTAACQLPGHMLMVAGHETGPAMAEGSFVHALI